MKKKKIYVMQLFLRLQLILVKYFDKVFSDTSAIIIC